MCFGNKLNQNRPEHCITPFPTPNNFCGGFALNAVLVDLGSGTCPIEVYMRPQTQTWDLVQDGQHISL